jgi:hypothetical protein
VRRFFALWTRESGSLKDSKPSVSCNVPEGTGHWPSTLESSCCSLAISFLAPHEGYLLRTAISSIAGEAVPV